MRSIVSAALLALLIGCGRENAETTTVSTETTTTTTTAVSPETAAAPAPVAECIPAPGRLCPVDEGASYLSFDTYRQRMLEAVRAKDEAKLVTMVDPKIRTSFGGGGGLDEFKKSLDWSDLEQILILGGSFRGEGEGRSFWAPYVYSNWPAAFDPFQHVAAIRAGVPIREAAAEGAPEVTTADWAILELIPSESQGPDAAWRHVRTADKKEGWVRSTDVLSPIGFRAGFSKRSGEWKMEALVAGD